MNLKQTACLVFTCLALMVSSSVASEVELQSCVGGEQACACDDSGYCDSCGPCRRYEIWLEYLLWDVWADGANGGATFGAQGGFRGSLKYYLAQDLGIRLQGMVLNASTTTGGGAMIDAKFSTYDLDFTYEDRLCNWDITTHGGLRIGHVEWSNLTPPLTAPMFNTRNFEGVGLSIGLEARRNIFGPVSVVFAGRYSSLLGNHELAVGAPGTTPTNFGESFVDVVNFSYGLEYAYDMGCTGRAFARLWWEHQVYNLGDIRQNTNIDKVNIGGGVFSIGFER